MIQNGSKERIRDINTQLILKTLLEEGPMSRAALSEYLHLTKATISAIVQILLDKGLVLEMGSKEETPRGRKPIMLTIDGDCAFILSVDLGTDSVTILTSNLTGSVSDSETIPNEWHDSSILPWLLSILKEKQKALPASRYGLIGISIAIHGVVHEDHVIFVPYSDYQGIDFKGIFSSAFGVPVWVDNEANLSVLGEWAFSHRCANMLSLSIHSGVGLGIIIDNHLIHGQNGFAGEFGHTILQLDGRPCPCGNCGCLEQYASVRALLNDYAQKKGRRCSPEELFNAYAAEEMEAREIITDFVRYLTAAVSNLLTTFNPEIIVLNSTFTNHLPELAYEIQKNLKNRMSPYCRLMVSDLKDQAIVFGGVYRISCSFLGLTEASLGYPI